MQIATLGKQVHEVHEIKTRIYKNGTKTRKRKRIKRVFMLFTIVLIKPIRIVKLEILGLGGWIYILKNYFRNYRCVNLLPLILTVEL